MPKLLTLKSVVLPKPVLNANGKPLRVTVTHRSRLIEIDSYDNVHVLADKVIDVDSDTAAELVRIGAAREIDAVLDDVSLEDPADI